MPFGVGFGAVFGIPTHTNCATPQLLAKRRPKAFGIPILEMLVGMPMSAVKLVNQAWNGNWQANFLWIDSCTDCQYEACEDGYPAAKSLTLHK